MSRTILDLTKKWEFKEYPLYARKMCDLENGDWSTTDVPCSIFNSLITADKIKLSDLNANPENFSWVSEKPWVYRKKFDIPTELLECDKIKVVFKGLDTISTIWLNDKLIARTNNMFIPFEFDITKELKPKANSLLVKFEPPIQYAKDRMKKYTSFENYDFSNPYRVYIRKAQYQFGWDFCPSLPGCGIWQPVYLEGIKKTKISNLHARTVDCNHNSADIKITVELDTAIKEQLPCRLTLSHNNKNLIHEITFKPGENINSTVIRIENPAFWWPAGYGPQNLYDINAELLSENKTIDSLQKSFGIRTVKLNRSPDKYGKKFRFEINDQPIYVMGANWVPLSIYAGSVKHGDYEKLLKSAADANINMLRVWGGGYYESEDFYELCDKLGIMVWQDFMFACAYYPDHDWFAEEVKKEATEIIKLLRNHPSLVLWCGNNEIDWLHSEGKLGKKKKFHSKSIYHKILPNLIANLDPDRNYIPTTPIGPAKKMNDSASGNIHQWEVWTNHKPVRELSCSSKPIPRFVTEFGMQSLSNIELIKELCPFEDSKIASQDIEKHNYQLDGNSRLYRYTGDLFGPIETLRQFIPLSQITQARAAKRYVEHLRANKNKNNGVLFWQFNDCCPAISWSAIDYAGTPKAIYYYAKRFFSKHLIALISKINTEASTQLSQTRPTGIIVINDSASALTATLNCKLITLSGSILDKLEFPILVAPFGTSVPLKLPKAMACPPEPTNSALYLTLQSNNMQISENLFFYLPDKFIDWPIPQITKKISKIDENKWKLNLKSNAVTTDVHISSAVPAVFSDNFINLIPPQYREIIVDFNRPVSSAESQIKVTVPVIRSL
ncbi:MAG: beta-mannosidase [Planctomycetota bacterium]